VARTPSAGWTARIVRAGTLALLLGLVAVTPADAAIETHPAPTALRLLSGDGEAMSGDGDRYFAYGIGRTLHVVDTKTGHQSRRTLPRDCFVSPDAAGDHVLLPCFDRRSLLVNVRTGRAVRLPPPPGTETEWDAIGRVWMRSVVPCDGGDWVDAKACVAYRSIRTGEVRVQPLGAHTEMQVGDDTDLDDPDLRLRTYCGPSSAGSAPSELPGLASGSHVLAWTAGGRVAIRTCGQASVTTIGGPMDLTDFFPPTLTGGWATWTEEAGRRDCKRAEAFGYDTARGIRYRWPVPAVERSTCVQGPYHTRYAMLLPVVVKRRATEQRFSLGFGLRVLMARLPARP